mgnify:CR=1 FL=1
MNKGIILIWPKHNEFKNIMLGELEENNYKLFEDNFIDVNKNYITNLLREIHYGSEWWRENLLKEVEKRLTNDKVERLIYLIVESENIHLNFKKFKKFVREKYRLDKSYFHLCDPDCKKHLGLNCSCPTYVEEFKFEFNKHLNFIKNTNGLHFLMNSVYKENYNFYKYFGTYKTILEQEISNHTIFITVLLGIVVILLGATWWWNKSGATKEIMLETGFTIQAPQFIAAGDIVSVNTETGEYSGRVDKA